MDLITGFNELHCERYLIDEVTTSVCNIPKSDEKLQLCVFSESVKVSTTLDIDYTVHKNDQKDKELELLWTVFIFLAVVNVLLLSIYLMLK